MPKEFESCVKSGGKVRTKSLANNKYLHVCVKDGKSYAGEVKSKSNSLNSSLKKAHKGTK